MEYPELRISRCLLPPVVKKKKKQKHALLLYQAGSRGKVPEIFRQFFETGTDEDYDIAKAKLKEHLIPTPKGPKIRSF